MSKDKVFWVWPSQTKKTLDDEVDDMLCAPCLSKMRQGNCGIFMENHLRCIYKATKTDSNLQECYDNFTQMVQCWAKFPKEYAKEIKSLSKQKENFENLTNN